MAESKYLEFRVIRDTGKTKVVSVDSKRQGSQLGVISWYGPWRQYVIFPNDDTLWNKGCLEDVNAYIDSLVAERTQPTSTGEKE